MDNQKETPSSEFPYARIKRRRHWSYLWMLPVLAAMAAIWLIAATWQQQGSIISIRFQQGYGLKTGDALRYRGIDVGRIESVSLADDLASLWVAVRLLPSARDLARSGSRFWITRPQLDITGISGLDTVVGANYLSLIPGQGAPQHRFTGLEQPPFSDVREAGGLEIVLTTPGKGSLRAGTPISYRQVIIGTLLAVDLARDASAVEAAAYIKPAYTNLIRENIRFWRTSAARVSAGFSGFSVDVDSVHNLILGGINLAIPPQPGQRVDAGFQFKLYDKPEEDWLDWVPGLSLYDEVELSKQSRPYLLSMQLQWRYRDWIYRRHTAERRAWLLPLDGGLLGPADVLQVPEEALPDSVQWRLEETPITPPGQIRIYPEGLAWMTRQHDYHSWPRRQIRHGEAPEDSVILAAIDMPTRFVGADRYRVGDDAWMIDSALPFDERWHGAAVMAERDGALLGLLLVREGEARVIAVPAEHTTQAEQSDSAGTAD